MDTFLLFESLVMCRLHSTLINSNRVKCVGMNFATISPPFLRVYMKQQEVASILFEHIDVISIVDIV